jgi:predicted phage terminase large subunit-like protein
VTSLLPSAELATEPTYPDISQYLQTPEPVTNPVVGPHPGPQEEYLTTSADIAIYGGAAGGGKSFGLLLECTRHVANPDFGFVVFRRTTPQITNEGALWDTSFEVFPALGASPRSHDHSWLFPSGCRGRFTHLEHDDTVQDYQGSQIPLIGFDELTHFTEKQFFYMPSRNRSTCGVRPYIRCTTNPDPKSWVRRFIEWWIDKDTGLPIPERSGVIRYFVRQDGKIVWVDGDYRDKDGNAPKSVTFISAKLSDNPTLVRKDPGYRANLASLSRVDRQRLLEGNWNASEDLGMFESSWIKFVDRLPDGIRLVRYWDRAATEVSDKNKDPDWTAGALGGIVDGELYVADMRHFRLDPVGNEREISQTAEVDGPNVDVYLEEEGGSAGKDVVSNYQRNVLKGRTVVGDRPTGDKVVRAKPWCALAERGHVKFLRGSWNQDTLDEVGSFPHAKKDQVDAISGLYKVLNEPMPGFY